MDLFATTGIHTLLSNGKPKKIGSSTIGARLSKDGGTVKSRMIHFILDGGSSYFFYENEKLTYHHISFETPSFIIKYYREAIENNWLPDELLEKITSVYTMKSMGF